MLVKSGRHLRQHLVAYLALFVALSGSSLAAATALVPNNSVGTAQLKDGAVTKKKINKMTIATLKGRRGPAGPRGTQGIQGPQGSQGPKGDRGAPGATVVVRTNVKVIDGSSFDGVAVSCAAGERATGGGGGLETYDTIGDAVLSSIPTKDGQLVLPNQVANGWVVGASNAGPTATSVNVFVLCASA